MTELKEELHDYANDSNGVPKHISEVESGKLGYYCIGCSQEMIAKKGEVLIHHFAHSPRDMASKAQCYYSSETHRHNLAKMILQILKRIKVPVLYKFPPDGLDGKPNKLRDARFIEAAGVKIQLSFYENEIGEIAWGRNDDSNSNIKKDFLIVPDVAFFDLDDKPILLIELVATHKIDEEKLLKIKCLGIDTVQVKINRGTPLEIESTFSHTSNTKWVYCNEQEHTTYLRIPTSHSEGIFNIDGFERELLKSSESFKCKSAQINNLIRGIRKVVESPQYKEFEQRNRGLLQKAQENTERYSERLRGLQESHRAAIVERFADQTRDIETQIGEIDREERRITKLYQEESERITGTLFAYRPENKSEIDRITGIIEQSGGNFRTLEERIREIEQEEAKFRARIELEEENTDAEILGTTKRIDDLPNLEQQLREKFEKREAEIRREFEDREGKLREEFRNLGDESVRAIQNASCPNTSRLFRRIKDILEAGESISYISNETFDLRRMRKAKKLFGEGAYKSWI